MGSVVSASITTGKKARCQRVIFRMILNGATTGRSRILSGFGRTGITCNFSEIRKENSMVLRTLGCLCVIGLCVAGSAAAQGDTDVYEQQLSQYSKFHKEYIEEQGKGLLDRQVVVRRLREKQQALLDEYDALEMENENTKRNISQLKDLNVKLRKNQAELQAQYDNLEELYNEQQKENEGLKEELKNGRAQFEKKVLDSYKEENAMLSERLSALQAREKELQDKIIELENSLSGEIAGEEKAGDDQD